MSKAIQCNRCSTFFNPAKLDDVFEFMEFYNPNFRTSSDYADNLYGRCFDAGLGRDEKLHLCPTCADDFKNFMRGEPVDVPQTYVVPEFGVKEVPPLV